MGKVLMKPERGQFFCWRWYDWYRIRKLNYCFGTGCVRMMVPAHVEWKQRQLGGILVPAGLPRGG